MLNALKWAVLALALALPSGASASPIQASYPAPIPAYDTIVRVDVGKGHGSGFILDDHRIVTAAHVVASFDKITVVLSNGVKRHGVLVVYDRTADVAIIRVTQSLDRQSRISCAPPPIGDDVRLVGYPLDLGRTETRGFVASAPRPIARFNSAFLADAGVAAGMSGGPTYSGGRVVGIQVAFVGTSPLGQPLGTSMTFIVAASEICRLARI